MSWFGLAFCLACVIVMVQGDGRLFIVGGCGLLFYFYCVESDRATQTKTKETKPNEKQPKENGGEMER